MGIKSACRRLPPDSRWRAAARNLFFGWISQFRLAAKAGVLQTFSDKTRASWLKSSLVIFTVVLGGLALGGVTRTNYYEFQKTIPKPGSIQWDINHSLNQQRQEQYRKRLAVPNAASANVAIAPGAYVTINPTAAAPSAPEPIITSETLLAVFLYAALFVLTGGLLLRKFAPDILEDINEQYNPWAAEPVVERIPATSVRAEEAAFGEFLTEFRVGPSTTPLLDLPAKDDPLGEFYVRAKSLVAKLRQALEEIRREASDPARQKMLANLYFDLGGLKGDAGLPQALPFWQVTSALEGLLKQLTEKMKNVSPSTLRAVAGGLDLLDDLCVAGLKLDLLTDRPFKFLVVDDDLISRQALSLSLKKAFSQPDLAVDGATALAQAAKQAYDVIFLDVQMPGMDGFELCTKIRETELNRATPVVFVTGQSDFDARAKSTLSGGNDLMGKPFLIFEVTVKALTLAFRGRLQNVVPKSIPTPEPSRSATVSPVPALEAPRALIRPIPAPRQPLKTPASSEEADEVTAAFLGRASNSIGPLQELCRNVLNATNEEMRQTILVDGFLRVNSLLYQTGAEVVHPAYQMSSALEGLFRKLLENSKYTTPSALATIAAAVDLMKDLCVPGLKADLALNPPVHMLVVDDDLIARRALVGALQTAFKKPESAESGEAALALTLDKTFDVIFLDVQMPGLDGFEVCAKIREIGPNRTTPVVFVTGQADFNTRAEMSRNGGDDLVGKPFLTSEITVKALTFALRGRLQQLKLEPCV